DIWSDHWQSCSYMGITCHWIDNAWNIQKRLLAYRCFNDPHTAQNISHLMFLIFEDMLVVTHLCNVACIFCEHLISNEPSLIECIISMKIKWEKYFLNIPDIFLCAIVLDPRLKLDDLGELLTLYYDSLDPITDACPSSMIISSVRHSLTEIYTEYNEKYDSKVATQTQHTTSSIIISRLTKAQNLIRDRTKRPRGSSSSNLELENCLTTTFDFSATDDENTFDILRWWAQKKQLYPILSLMAKEILACPVSTVAVEQASSMRHLEEAQVISQVPNIICLLLFIVNLTYFYCYSITFIFENYLHFKFQIQISNIILLNSNSNSKFENLN
ncbi:hypothetical protein F511_18759, partial [Dorcoceras hygrometricum]